MQAMAKNKTNNNNNNKKSQTAAAFDCMECIIVYSAPSAGIPLDHWTDPETASKKNRIKITQQQRLYFTVSL